MSAFDNIYKTKLIYVMTITDAKHQGLLKIGEATVESELSFDRLNPNCKELNDSAKKRIKEYTNTAGVEFTLLHTELAVRMVAKDKRDIQMKMFSDDDIRKVLENSGFKHVKLGTTTADEWYKITLDTARAAIKAYKDGYANLSNAKFRQTEEVKPLELREEQLDAVDKTIKAYKKSDNYLWNAKMRFGKTISALEVVKRMQFAKTIIITHRPVVDEGWYEDFKKVFAGDSECIYGSKKKGYEVKDLLKTGKKFVYFASLQDLRESKAVGGKYDKNNDVFETVWDFVIVDEAHEGTKTALGDEVINKLLNNGENHRAKFLALSGTAFNLISDFEDTNVYTWDYIMEQAAKQAWYQTHCGEHNPYEVLPSMEIRTYDLDELVSDAYMDIEDKAFNFREFFRVWTGDKNKDKREIPVSGLKGEFIHKKDVQKFLDLLVAKDDKNHYPFSTEEYRSLFQHSLWIVPGVKEAAALSKLLQQHKVFGNGAFNIVNVAGKGDFDDENKSEEDLTKVKNAIADCEDGQYTITLSCGKLTQGVTVPEWTAVFMLAGSYSTSATRYLQTIFRVQSPCVKGGLMKTKCYVFDFAPDRTLKMMAQAAAISGKPGKTKVEDRESLQQLLNFCPVIGLKGGKMFKYDTNKLLQQLKKAYAERAVEHGFDDSNIYNDSMLTLNEMDIKQFENLRAIIGTTKAMPKTKEIQISVNGLTGEKYKELEKLNRKPKRELTPEEEERLKALQEAKKQRNVAISILRGISIRMPLLLYGAEIDAKTEITLEKFPDLIDENSWTEFMPEGVTKKLFAEFTKYYDEDVFIAAGKKIRAIALSADELPPLGRVQKISRLFANFKNPDKETVLTPWRVVNMHMSDTLGGYDFFDKEHKEQIPEPRFVEHKGITDKTFGNKDAKILEINSKTGLYPLYAAYSIFVTKCKAIPDGKLNEKKQLELWDDTVQKNIYVVCKTKMAKTITQRTLTGYRNIKCNTHSFDDLINMIQNKSESFKKKVVSPQFWGKEGTTMKFDAIIGNPPYQLQGGSGGNNDAPIYQYFVEVAEKVKPTYTSLIIPSRWFAGGRENLLGEFRRKLLNGKHIETMFVYADSHQIFPNVEIKGGICYFLMNYSFSNDCQYNLIEGEDSCSMVRDLSEFDILIQEPVLSNLVKKINAIAMAGCSVETLISYDTPFGIPSNPRTSKKTPFNVYEKSSNGHNTLLYHIENNKRKIEFVSRKEINKHSEDIDKPKVFIPGGYGAGEGWPHQIIGIPEIAKGNSVCSQSYLYAAFDSDLETLNFYKYLHTKFLRALVAAVKITQSAPNHVYRFVPMQDFTSKSDIDWSKDIADIDKQLYKKYKLTEDEISYIESHIKPMRGVAEESEEYLYTTRNGIQAKAEYIDEKRFKLFAGSQVDMTKDVDIKKTVARAKRKELLDSGNIVKKNGKFYTNIDVEFVSPSAASDFVLGGSTNGWTEWKDKNGKTLEDIYRQ